MKHFVICAFCTIKAVYFDIKVWCFATKKTPCWDGQIGWQMDANLRKFCWNHPIGLAHWHEPCHIIVQCKTYPPRNLYWLYLHMVNQKMMKKKNEKFSLEKRFFFFSHQQPIFIFSFFSFRSLLTSYTTKHTKPTTLPQSPPSKPANCTALMHPLSWVRDGGANNSQFLNLDSLTRVPTPPCHSFLPTHFIPIKPRFYPQCIDLKAI